MKLPKNFSEMEIPQNSAGMKTPKAEAKQKVSEQAKNESGTDENVTEQINHKQEAAELVADENWTEIGSVEEEVVEEKSEFPIITVDALRPRNDPVWNSDD